MLPIALSEEQVDDLFQPGREASGLPADGRSGDRARSPTTTASSLTFDVEPFRRHCLLNGLDDIGLTLEHEDKIAAYEQAHGSRRLGNIDSREGAARMHG